jgi:hypothetical protein
LVTSAREAARCLLAIVAVGVLSLLVLARAVRWARLPAARAGAGDRIVALTR